MLYSIKYRVTCFPCSYEYTQVLQINHALDNIHSSKLNHQGIFQYTEIQLFLILRFLMAPVALLKNFQVQLRS